MRKSYVAIALASCMCLGVSACGGSSGGSSSSSSTIKLKTFQAASVVIGQPDFISNSANQGSTPAANTLDRPYDNVFVDSAGTLFLPDEDNNRVLGFNKVPTSNDASADFVLGQSAFNTNGGSDAADGMDAPQTPIVYKGKLLVDEWGNNRVLIWNSVPSTNGAPADVVVGQSAFGTSNYTCSPTGMDQPEGIAVTPGGKLIVADSSNNRVLIFNTIPTANGATPDLVLGQNTTSTCVTNNDGTGVSGNPSASNFNLPSAVWSNGKKLVVVDSSNNRVLIWNTFPTSSFQPADVVLGQQDFICGVYNNDGTGTCTSGSPSAQNMDFPFVGVYSNGTQLFVTDSDNNRVLVWNKFPTTNFQPANVVLGQPNFTCGVSNNDGTGSCASGSTSSAQGLDFPTGVYQSGNRLFVADTDNSRQLIFKGK